MPDTYLSEPPVIRFRGLDIEAMTALQMRNIDAIRRMANLMLDSIQAITERHAAFLKAGADQINAKFERAEGASDPKAIFERQPEAYRDLFRRARHPCGRTYRHQLQVLRRRDPRSGPET